MLSSWKTHESRCAGADLSDDGIDDTFVSVLVIPVADVDRAKRFYEGLGWAAGR
jgi:hypothetical protein